MENETRQVVVPDITPYVLTGAELLESAFNMPVESQEDLILADALKGQICAKLDSFLPQLDAKCKEADGIHKFFTTLRRKATEGYDAALKELNTNMAHFEFQRQEKIRQDNARRAAEAQRRADEQRAREIAEAKQKRDADALEALKNAPPPVPVMTAPPKPVTAPKLANSSFREAGYDFTVTDIDALPRKYLMVDKRKIDAEVKAQGEKCDIPGITVFKKEPTVASR